MFPSHPPPAPRARHRARLAAALRAIVAALPLAAGACVLDLSGLSDAPPAGGTGPGGAGGSGASATTDTTPTTSSGGAGGTGPATGGTGGAGPATGGGGTGGGPTCSPLSCGACEEPCPAGGCPPAVIANGADVVSTPLGIAVAPGALYWVNETTGTVARLLDDGSPATVIATGFLQPRTIAAGADLVVWSAKGGLWVCPPDSCEANKKKIADPIASNSIQEIAYDGTHVYWADRGTSQDAQDGQVRRCDPDDCQPTAIATAQWAPIGVALLDDTLLWGVQASPFPDGRIMKGSKLAAGSEELTAGVVRPTGIAADALRVYWTQYNADGKIFRCPHTMGYCETPVDVVPALVPLVYPRDVALAGGRIYFTTTEEDGAVRSCPVPGCGAALPEVHASGRPALHRMAVGATCVFFTDETDGGSVVKVAR